MSSHRVLLSLSRRVARSVAWSLVVIALSFSFSFSFSSPTLIAAEGVPAEGRDGKRALSLEDMMRFRQIQSPTISEDGAWIVFEERPDRGDGDVRVVSTTAELMVTLARGTGARFSRDARFVAAARKPKAADAAAAKKSKEKPQGNGLYLLDTQSGDVIEFDEVKAFDMSRDSQWLVRWHSPEWKPESSDEGPPSEEEASTSAKGSREAPEAAAGAATGRPARPSWPSAGGSAGSATETTASEVIASEAPATETTGEEAKSDGKKASKKSKKPKTGVLIVRHLPSGIERHYASVLSFSLDPESRALVIETSCDEGLTEALGWVDLGAVNEAGEIGDMREFARDGAEEYSHLTWVKDRGTLAFLRAARPASDEGAEADASSDEADASNEEADGGDGADDGDENDGPLHASIWTWRAGDSAPRSLLAADAAPDGWYVPVKNRLHWTRDGARLFFGLRPTDAGGTATPGSEVNDAAADETNAADPAAAEAAAIADLFDVDAILEKRELDVWHWQDPLIVPHQKKVWAREKDRTFQAVIHVDSGSVVQLADLDLPDVGAVENASFALGRSREPYMREVTWDGTYSDLYAVDLADGSRREIVRRQQGSTSISPDGHFIVFYNLGGWHLYDCRERALRRLTHPLLGVPFANEDHDYPSAPGGYGVAGWEKGDAAVYINDKFDIWRFPTGKSDARPIRLTGGVGRQRSMQFRIVRTDPDALYFEPGEALLLSAYHDRRKHRALYRAYIGQVGVEPLLEGEYRLDFIAKAKESDRVLFRRQSYREFPDLWVGDTDMRVVRKLTDVNPQIDEFAWGDAQLVEWSSLDGKPLQGVLITPDGHRPGERLPVLVYFYRFFSQRLHDFNSVVINHRPCFPYYASNGYAVFLPDIRFEVGRPGLAATKCLVPGVQKIIDMGVADPDAIGLHGHSWSGYQAAFMITQTDIFAAAVAGAPVSNMTSAYSGIRLGSGMARQFQYEKSQSRIGGSLWDSFDHYVENSPVFYADRINTPLLIQFGDIDEAVPWQQGIEMYLAMRRLDKDCIFLQYRGEPHHLKKYPNKVDYTIKMKQYFDHYLKGAEAPAWMTQGVPYSGK